MMQYMGGTTVYIDTLFFINFIINYLLLLTGAKATGLRIFRLKMAAGAMLGGLYAVASVFPSLAFLSHFTFKIGFALLMVLVAFGPHPSCGFWRITLIFLGISAALGGAIMALELLVNGGRAISSGAYYFHISARVLILVSAVCYVLVSLLFKAAAGRLGRRHMVKVTATHEGRSIDFEALVDTGNTLSDPITNAEVIIAEKELIEKLLPETARFLLDRHTLRDPVAAMEKLASLSCAQRFRLISYQGVGVKSGMLLAFRPDRAAVEGKEKRGLLIALSPNKLCEGTGYAALAGI